MKGSALSLEPYTWVENRPVSAFCASAGPHRAQVAALHRVRLSMTYTKTNLNKIGNVAFHLVENVKHLMTFHVYSLEHSVLKQDLCIPPPNVLVV